MVTSIPINLLPFYGGGMPPQPLRKVISHQQWSKTPFGESPGGGLLEGGSLNKNPFVGPPLNPSDGAYGWPSFEPNMWVPTVNK
jgi:hypothetical protein